MKMLKRWISVCLVILLLAGVAFDHSSLIGSTVEAAGLEETDGAEPAETPDASEETTDVPSLLSEGDGSDTPAPEEQTVTNTETETEAPAEKTETKQEGTQETGEQTETTTPETTTPDTTAPETTTGNQETESAPDTVTEEPVQSPAFESSYAVEDGSAVIYASAAEGVFPEGVSFTAVRIDF